jgi:polysaccharide biosynthesis/export protein
MQAKLPQSKRKPLLYLTSLLSSTLLWWSGSLFWLTLTATAQDGVTPPVDESEPVFPVDESDSTFPIEDTPPDPTFNLEEPTDPLPNGYTVPPYQERQSRELNIYRLDTGDGITISVPEFPEFDALAIVDAQGNIALPLLGRVQVFGLTVEEVENKVSYELNRRFLQEPPVVQVLLSSPRPAQITILGEIETPGYYSIVSGTPIDILLNTAGGITPNADLRSIVLRRQLADGSSIEEKVDLYSPLLEGKSPKQVNLQNGDVVIVSKLEPDNLQGYDRALVARSTFSQLATQAITVRVLFPAGNTTSFRQLELRPGSTFLDVIAALPQDNNQVDREEISLIRFDPVQGKIITQTINADAAIEGDLSQNVPLRDEDAIVIGRTLLGDILSTFSTITEPIRDVFGFTNTFDRLFGNDNGLF